MRTEDGRTALDIAREKNNSEVVGLLSEPRYAPLCTSATPCKRRRQPEMRIEFSDAEAHHIGHMLACHCLPLANEWRRVAIRGGGDSSPRTTCVASERLPKHVVEMWRVVPNQRVRRAGGRTESRRRVGGQVATRCG